MTRPAYHMTFWQIANEMGICHQRAEALYKQAIAKLKKRPHQMRKLQELASEAERLRESK